MTPEERAKAAFEKIKQELGHACACVGPQAGADMCPCASRRHEIIATAICEACNEKLEEAVLALVPGRDAMRDSIDKHFSGEDDAVFAKLGGLIVDFADACMSDIRSLKYTTP